MSARKGQPTDRERERGLRRNGSYKHGKFLRDGFRSRLARFMPRLSARQTRLKITEAPDYNHVYAYQL